MKTPCPFCKVTTDRIFYTDDLIVGIWDGFPVSPGHALLVPKRHVATWFEATEAERSALMGSIDTACKAIERQHSPDGYNFGINSGAAAGQSVPHLHLHVIPRYQSDVPDPRGGVRLVIPELGNYLATGTSPGPPVGTDFGLSEAPHARDLVHGDDDGLLPHLIRHLDAASSVDLAIAFVLTGGVAALEDRLTDLLRRGGRLRILTGDYLGATDPDALLRLLDLREAADSPESVELRVFEATSRSFHPKTYIFRGPEGDSDGIGFVGSSNLTRTALTRGVEWNYRIVSARSPAAFSEIVQQFDRLFVHEATRPLDEAWIAAYRKRRKVKSLLLPGPAEAVHDSIAQESYQALPLAAAESVAGIDEVPLSIPEPWSVQQEALEALRQTRDLGNRAGLVVLATGLGKTWLAAFDAMGEARDGSMGGEFGRVLFVAHREEILEQARRTFRRIAPEVPFGSFTGQEKTPNERIVFASIQTLSRVANLRRFSAEDFDYIVVDEFHHASATSYRRVLDHFAPRFLLGLTATPERTDGGDLLALCEENLVYRCDLAEGIERALLVPFHYYGVPDTIDYRNIPWRSNRFNEEELTRASATLERAENSLEQYRKHAGGRTLGFCVSIRHADFMKEYFTDQGLRAASVHSGPRSDPRTGSLEALADGGLDIIFAVDIFNEGVDVPAVDTVLMLRPTTSRILWLQQLGRGLRLFEGKTHLTVIDYIGNHKVFLIKIQALFGLGLSHQEIAAALESIEAGTQELPPECSVTYDLEAKDILRSLLQIPKGEQVLRSFCELYRELHGVRPTAIQAYHEKYNPRAVRKHAGSWLEFLRSIDCLTDDELQALGDSTARAFLEELEKTPMTKSYKMLLLLAMLASDCLPGEQGIEELSEAFARRARRSALLVADMGTALDDPIELRRSLERNPIHAWVGGNRSDGSVYFAYEDGTFRTTFSVPSESRDTFQSLA